jgi:hypothetical protein
MKVPFIPEIDEFADSLGCIVRWIGLLFGMRSGGCHTISGGLRRKGGEGFGEGVLVTFGIVNIGNRSFWS